MLAIYQPTPSHSCLASYLIKGGRRRRILFSSSSLSLSLSLSLLAVVEERKGKEGKRMASFVIAFGPPAAAAASGRVFAATAAKGGSSEEKSILDWILGGMQKEDQLLETDPILKKVEERNGGTSGSRKTSVSVPPSKKSGGFGGLFAKK